MFYLKRNLPSLERVLRLLGAAVLAGLALSGLVGGVLALAAWVMAATLLVTGLVGFCPACAMLGRKSQQP